MISAFYRRWTGAARGVTWEVAHAAIHPCVGTEERCGDFIPSEPQASSDVRAADMMLPPSRSRGAAVPRNIQKHRLQIIPPVFRQQRLRRAAVHDPALLQHQHAGA